ncbi:hypothetical protein PHK61_11755 [Actinomycetospora lutea]|uniref:hypothetical protein n=1 Tax=Actinomycetospora lutea TaxID=663604 RepID=UPI0023665DEF|nr:hypothetical protein [Actinomycetospora lutea]MDD7939090.1 hypothetical protein [Actinomycetospora lutea]
MAPIEERAGSRAPLPRDQAALAVARCVVVSLCLLVRGRLRCPRTRVGVRVRFGDGSTATIYRETTVADAVAARPCALVVRFRLRWVRGRGHALFRAESLLNTPLFAGFPGFVAKWWLAADDNGVYRGLYEWDDAARADAYARALWRVLALVSVPGSIDYTVLPGRHRDDLLAAAAPGAVEAAPGEWWRPVAG